MKTLKTIKAVSAAILFTAGLASAQTAYDGPIEADNKITFSVEITTYADITVHNQELDETDVTLFRPNVTVATAPATGAIEAGRVHVSTNLSQWDVLIGSKNNGRLVDSADAFLACGTPTTVAALQVFSCLAPSSSATCGLSTVAAPNNTAITASSGRRNVPLAGTSTTPASMARAIKGTAAAQAAVGTTFTGAERNGTGDVYLVIEANVNCASTALTPGEDADGTAFTEELDFTLTANW